jgi:hypothetical protein
MYIRTQKVLRELDIDFKNDEPIGFVFTKPHEATVEVRQASPEEQQLGYKKGTLLCTVSISLDTSAEIAAIFQSLANNRLPEDSKEPTKWNDYIDQAGNITDKYVVPLHLLPKAAQNFCDEGNEKLSILVRNALSILRWRYGLTGPHNPFVSMIKNYLPLMPTKLKINGTVVPPPKEILRSLQQGVEARNRTIHIGAAPPNRDELKELLLSVKDLLYILDYYCGFDWALTNVRPHIQKELAV